MIPVRPWKCSQFFIVLEKNDLFITTLILKYRCDIRCDGSGKRVNLKHQFIDFKIEVQNCINIFCGNLEGIRLYYDLHMTYFIQHIFGQSFVQKYNEISL